MGTKGRLGAKQRKQVNMRRGAPFLLRPSSLFFSSHRVGGTAHTPRPLSRPGRPGLTTPACLPSHSPASSTHEARLRRTTRGEAPLRHKARGRAGSPLFPLLGCASRPPAWPPYWPWWPLPKWAKARQASARTREEGCRCPRPGARPHWQTAARSRPVRRHLGHSRPLPLLPPRPRPCHRRRRRRRHRRRLPQGLRRRHLLPRHLLPLLHPLLLRPPLPLHATTRSGAPSSCRWPRARSSWWRG